MTILAKHKRLIVNYLHILILFYNIKKYILFIIVINYIYIIHNYAY